MAITKAQSNLERLVAENVIDPKHLSEEHKTIINTQMTAAEVESLINIKRKLGGGPPWDPKSKRGYVAML